MKKLLLVLLSIFIFSCNSKHEQVAVNTGQTYTHSDVAEKDSLLYFKSENTLFSGTIVEKGSLDKIILELTYKNGQKHGQEIHYEYFESDPPLVVLEGNWIKGKKTGIWKSHDGEGQMTIIREYN